MSYGLLAVDDGWLIGGGIFLVVCFIIFFALFARYFGLWIQAKTTHAGIGFVDSCYDFLQS